MSYLFHTDEDRREMLEVIGEPSVEALIERLVPEDCRLDRALQLPPAMSEIELQQHFRGLAGRNASAASHPCFLGAGAYDHFVPAAVDALAARGEFYTSYTPYQPEVSQGNLQAMFEYGSLICELTGLDVSNASLYDGGTATAEAVLMALSTTHRNRVVLAGSLHPEYRQVLETYLSEIAGELHVVPCGTEGLADPAEAIDDDTACVVVQHPNFFGRLEKVAGVARAAHDRGALCIQVFDPVSLGLLKRPGDFGADIAVAEGQSLGNRLADGGPYLGIMACRSELMRRLPGRIAGETVDRHGNRCWVLTLQTREQHIRRERATSNICTNQGLLALRATIHLSLLGPQGLRETAEHCLRKTAYARQRIGELERFELPHDGPVFKEFVVRDRAADVDRLLRHARDQGILAGVPLGGWFPELADCFAVAVTESRTAAEIDRLVDVLAQAPA